MLFRRKIEKSCSYCSNGTKLEDGQILCVKKGIRQSDEKCRKFVYDPFKRTPLKPKPIDFSDFDNLDYTL